MDLSYEVIALLALVAVLAGFIDAIAGGGGLIVLPALLAAGVPPVAALATNKIQGSFGTASAAWSFWRAGRIDFKLLRWPIAATLVGAMLGAMTVTLIDSYWLLVALPVLLAAVALYFLLGPKASDEDSRARLSLAAYTPVAGCIGFYDGFFGPGTGSFFALSLVTLLGMGLTRATAHTKVLNFTSNVFSVIVLAIGGHVLWILGAAMAVGQVIGGRLGSQAAMRFGPKLIRPLLVVISLAIVLKLLSDPANPLRVAVTGWFAS
jgi:uncharacterized membrane protein YfcA